jgi:hypothetical protein
MLFRRLIEAQSRSAAVALWVEGVAISVAAHVGFLGLWLVTTADLTFDGPRDIADNFSAVEYMIPPDRLQGIRPKQERIDYAALPVPTGQGQAPLPRDEARLEVVRPEGDAQQDHVGPQQPPPPQPEVLLDDSTFTVLEVDSAAARYEDSAAPPYPPTMLKRRIEGNVIAQYVVDTTGRADVGSFTVLSATNKDFAESVRSTLPQMRFKAAMMGTVKVRQLVQQMFTFKIDTTLLAGQPRKPGA